MRKTGLSRAIAKQTNRTPEMPEAWEETQKDDYPARLHEGERVQTAMEARANKNAPSIVITGNSFAVHEEADVYKIAQALVGQIQAALLTRNK